MYKFPFEKLNVWQESQDFCTEIYQITEDFPKEEMYGLTSQLRRAAVSISSNLAEGTSRKSPKDQARFSTYAYSSLMEVVSQLFIAESLRYIQSAELEKMRKIALSIANKINGLKQYQDKRSSGVEDPGAPYGEDESIYNQSVQQFNAISHASGKSKSTIQQNPTPAKQPFFTHPTAVIDENVTIGVGTKIWHFSHLMTGCQLGENCNLGQNVVVSPDVVLGNNVKVQNNVSIYTGVTCDDDVFLGPSMVFTNVVNPRSGVNRRGQYSETHVGRGASIGANATIVCGHNIGEYAFIGAGAVVTKTIPAYALVVGNPARQIGWMSQYGHRLHFDENQKATCPESGVVYQLNANTVSVVETDTV